MICEKVTAFDVSVSFVLPVLADLLIGACDKYRIRRIKAATQIYLLRGKSVKVSLRRAWHVNVLLRYCRILLCDRGRWGTVCSTTSWTYYNALTVCRQLGYVGAFSYSTDAHYGQGSGPIWMDQVSCTGREKALSLCSFHAWGVESCSHREDVGVSCRGKNKVSNIQYMRCF